jgi:hypothetical protein
MSLSDFTAPAVNRRQAPRSRPTRAPRDAIIGRQCKLVHSLSRSSMLDDRSDRHVTALVLTNHPLGMARWSERSTLQTALQMVLDL